MTVTRLCKFLLLLVAFANVHLLSARKTSANQVPLGISRATSHAKQIRLSGPRTSPSHRLEEQEKLKNKVFKQVAWKNRKLEEKLLDQQSQINTVLPDNIVSAANAVDMTDDSSKLADDVSKRPRRTAGKTSSSDRSILLRRLLKIRKTEE
jgi:small-conductance mechanosensitive channel